ncbi:hypothetical protein BC343_05175 [Mucilaginibacter pedocola]|uniref:Sulfatase N-terminal domain-containing protein n=1 Tax=Mucilaginibacter pedocola TaxID=1792845 RepID=A0A1S9PF22_9SPHI|nr:hypothetical protein BC343_05175 [Mucilaginibacter pedocola]
MFVYLFGLFFLLFKTSQFFPSFQPAVFLLLLLAYSAINFIVISVLRRIPSYKYGLSWLLVLWVAVLFTYPILGYLAGWLPASFIHAKYLLIAAVAVGLLLGYFYTRIPAGKIMMLNRGANVFILILTGMVVFSGLKTAGIEAKHKQAIEAKSNIKVSRNNKSDIIWIMMDEYASPSSLKNELGFTNPLVDSLKKLDFFVFDSLKSRSDTTIYSVSSLFNFDDSLKVSNYNYAAGYLRDSKWPGVLQRDGYSFINLEFLDIAGQDKVWALGIFPDDYLGQVLFNSMFYTGYNNSIDPEKKPIDHYNQFVIKQLEIKAAEKRQAPAFIWAHLLIPHAPFFRNAAGDPNSNPIQETSGYPKDELIKQYIPYLLYGNKVILDILNHIPDWRTKTIVISGDHGARMLLKADDARRKETFAAVYYPRMDSAELSRVKFLQQIPLHLH